MKIVDRRKKYSELPLGIIPEEEAINIFSGVHDILDLLYIIKDFNIRVLLIGVPISNVVDFDIEEHQVERHMLKDDKYLLLNNEIVTEVLYGKIELEKIGNYLNE